MHTDRLPGASTVEDRAKKHAALADAARLKVVDLLQLGDASPSELQGRLGLSSNLMAHHLNVLTDAGLVTRRRSQGDRRRSYVTLLPAGLDAISPLQRTGLGEGLERRHKRILFVCTANSARSQLATALWHRASDLPVGSAGTHPAPSIAPGASAAAERHHLRLVEDVPRHLDDVARDGDLIVTVCDSAHEDLRGRDTAHWAVPDPVPVGSAAAFDATVADLSRRITHLADLTGSRMATPTLEQR